MTCFVELIQSGLNRQLELLRGKDEVVLKILLVLIQILLTFLQHTLEPQPFLIQVLTHFLHLGENRVMKMMRGNVLSVGYCVDIQYP